MPRSSKRTIRWLNNRWLRRIAYALVGVPLLLVVIFTVFVVIRTLSAPTYTIDFTEMAELAKVEGVDDSNWSERAQRLAGALRIPTISYGVGSQNEAAFLDLHKYIEASFPLIHNSSFVKREVINVHSLLYSVTGSSTRKIPYMLLSHLDVVPADAEDWEEDPFGGNIVNDTYIYGRGTIDDKGGVFGILEALEYILSKGERPQRSFYIAFGHDEEVSGQYGAQEIARELKNRGVTEMDFILDEGLTVTQGIVPGIETPVAFIGITEKGYLTLELSVEGTPGHASFPPAESAIGILANAVARLEQYKLPSKFGTGPEKYTFQYLSPHVTFGYRLLYANMDIFSTIMSKVMERNHITNALTRTTTAITIFHGGIKDNVVPDSATAVVNHRIHPSEMVADILEYDKMIVNDPKVNFRVKQSREAPPTSPFGPNDLPYQIIAASIVQTFPDAVVVPGVMIANTDTRWYLDFTTNILRFFPTLVTPSDTSRYHGNNERIAVEHYNKAVNFYYRVMKNADHMIGFQDRQKANNIPYHDWEL